VEAATFASMKREGAALLPMAEAGFDGGSDGFIFAGRNERWREALSEADVALYRARAAREMGAGLNQWLAQGRRGGDPRAAAE
jgi:aryl sulfotransferase